MFKVFYEPGSTQLLSELLIDGQRSDYEFLAETVDQVLASCGIASISVESRGPIIIIKKLSIRVGEPPNRVSVENDEIIISIAPALRESFISFIEFPADEDLPKSAVRYHHHYDSIWNVEGQNIVARDSVPVVFGLASN